MKWNHGLKGNETMTTFHALEIGFAAGFAVCAGIVARTIDKFFHGVWRFFR
jgi:hypothetical protein